MSAPLVGTGKERFRHTHRQAGVMAIWCLALVSAPAAGDTPYCRKVQARAKQYAALQQWPKLTVEGLRFPWFNTDDMGLTFGDNYQVRAGLTYSLTSVFQAAYVQREADIDCELHEASESLRVLINQTANDVVLSALSSQVGYLEEHQEEWIQLLSRANDQLAAGRATVVEVQDLRRSIAALEQKLEDRRSEKERLKARTPSPPAKSLSALAEKVTTSTMELERESSGAKLFDAFQVRLAGGVIPGFSGASPSWYGRIEVSYNLGGIVQSQRATDYLEARADEMMQASYELPFQAHELRRDLQFWLAKTRRELNILETYLASIDSTKAVLEASKGVNVDQLGKKLTLEKLLVESDRRYLISLIQSLSSLVE